ncbi:exopolysaccharide Pel transporter PelG [Mangrovibacillus cuniculi]|uniref:Exopolysaccharide Pel transporter PelG n=1 Tax=Mangrovibacillus cuniculi TaxID=2593652 RepID=A0A7S8CD04_9BACI|nr:exopolysaccharide Pel transporter PelG [Mangrovibacillus cuniculi]QPC47730.1 exopolysaccharide Pel transporter PelG [Mangrovibacillus cuniculi]
MAGIGFQLKKMFREDYFSTRARAYAFTILITSGPWLVTILTLAFLQWGMLRDGANLLTKELFVVSVSYTFVFSQVIFMSLQLFVTRYVADLFYEKKMNDVFSSSIGLMKVTVVAALLLWLPFALLTPIPFWYDWLLLLLFLTMNLIWVLFLYSNAMKTYQYVIRAFAVGAGIIVLSYILLPFDRWLSYMTPLQGAAIMLVVFLCGMLTTFCMLLYNMLRSFPDRNSKRPFAALAYAKKYPALVITGVSYGIGLWVHNGIIWFGEGAILLEGTFRYHPSYDTAVFWSFLSIIPTMMMFVISIETRFYERYWSFYGYINEGGSLEQIKESKSSMLRVLREEVIRLVRTQGLFSFLLLLLLPTMVSIFELSGKYYDILPMTIIGVFSTSLVLSFSLLLLYFDDRKGAAYTNLLFLVGIASVTAFLLPFGIDWYGVGFAIGATLSFLFGALRLQYYVKDADYYIFMRKEVS